MAVTEGSITALLGSNGAGKSTTLKAISGTLRAEEGQILRGSVAFGGKQIDNLDPEDVARLGIRHVLEGRLVFPHLSTEENLLMGAHLRRDRRGVREDLERVYQYVPVLKPLRRRQSGYLSGGEQQMLVIGRALMARPKLMLLDEPSLGLAPMLVSEIFAVLKRLNQEQGISMIIAEQNVTAALATAHSGYVLDCGRVVLSGSASALNDSPLVKQHYLGLTEAGCGDSYRNVKVTYTRSRTWGG